ncbi:hypothetical protein ABB02_00793 [Clostridiaceae bacterium JG1575]|nr:hypothetical protein ABB02_00793 [Clostridiaceae bacterium JG1575]
MKRFPLFIDLTPLLDVILILLFMVLVTSGAKVSSEKAAHAKAQAQSEAKLQTLQQQREALENTLVQKDLKLQALEAKAGALTGPEETWYHVYSQRLGKVELRFSKEGAQQSVRLLLAGGEVMAKPATISLEEWVQKALAKVPQEVIILTFRYQDDAIYWRDYTRTRDFLIELTHRFSKKIIYEEVQEPRAGQGP